MRLRALLACLAINCVPLACATISDTRISLSQAGLFAQSPAAISGESSQLDRSTDALLDAIESGTGERPVFDGAEFSLASVPSADAPAPASKTGWSLERRVVAMDILRMPVESKGDLASFRRARAVLGWDVALDEQWSTVDAGLVRDALARADKLLGIVPALPPRQREAEWVWPVSPVKVTSAFGARHDPFGEGIRRHLGLDLGGDAGQQVSCAADGVVMFRGLRGAYGLHVEVRHRGGYATRYAHLSAAFVRPGDRVRHGETIGKVGATGRATGPHLHFEVWRDGAPMNPADALPEAPPAWFVPMAAER